MATVSKKWLVFSVVMLAPLLLLAAGPLRENLGTQIRIIAIVNTILVITSAISIIQLIFKGDHNRTPFQIFNILFAVIFYALSIPFLLHHKDYFIGFENLSDAECLKKYFLDTDLISWIRRIIPVGILCNIIYLIRYASSYYLE